MHNTTKRGKLKKLVLALGLSGTFFLNACTSNAPSNQTIVTSTDDYEANLAANESESFYETESETFDREALYRTDDDNKPADGWITNADGTMGYCQNGYLLTGYQMIDDSRYLFSDDGIMQTGRYTDENGDTYCFTDCKITAKILLESGNRLFVNLPNKRDMIWKPLVAHQYEFQET